MMARPDRGYFQKRRDYLSLQFHHSYENFGLMTNNLYVRGKGVKIECGYKAGHRHCGPDIGYMIA